MFYVDKKARHAFRGDLYCGLGWPYPVPREIPPGWDAEKEWVAIKEEWVDKELTDGRIIPIEKNIVYGSGYINRRGYEALKDMFHELFGKGNDYHHYSTRKNYETYEEFIEACLRFKEQQIRRKIANHKKYLILMNEALMGYEPQGGLIKRAIRKIKFWMLKKACALSV